MNAKESFMNNIKIFGILILCIPFCTSKINGFPLNNVIEIGAIKT